MTAVHLPTGATTTTTYDPTFTYYPASETDAQQRTVSYTYDSKGNRQTATNQLPTENQVQYFYNNDGTLDHVIDARGKTTAYAYTYANRILTQRSVTPPLAVARTTTTFDGIGRPHTVTDGKGQVTTFTYDALDRTTNLLFNDATSIGYVIDGDGNIQSRVDGTGTTGYAYDALNRLLMKVLPPAAGGQTLANTYDPLGNLLTYSDAGGTVTYGYDAANRLTTLTEPGGAGTSFGYDNNNLHTSTTYPGGVTLTLAYDASQRLTTITGAQQPSGAWLTRFTYSYANGGSDTGLRQSVMDSVANTTTTYAYDPVNRLTGAVTTGNQPSTYQYGYDGNGNRTSSVIGGAGTSATFDDANELQTWNTGLTNTYTYDADGNETGSSNGLAFQYNAKNQTTSVTGLFGPTLAMGYADAGQGERTSAGGSAYVNSSLGIGSETKGGATTYYTRTPSGHLVSQRTPSGTYYYLFDGLGSVVGLVDTSQNVVARYGYDPYGQTVTKTGPAADGNPFRYTGAYLDSTGLYKMGERYYDPARGRFTQLDPLGNGYVYASDNPINLTDSSGLCDPEECGDPPPSEPTGPPPDEPVEPDGPPPGIPVPDVGDPMDPGSTSVPGLTWGGSDPPVAGGGSFYPPAGGPERLYPDPNGHPKPPGPSGPHWDWTDPTGNGWWIDWPSGGLILTP